MVSIFEYSNYRSFLKDAYHALKSAKPQFSFRLFSRLAGFTSPNFLKLVMEGQRNLSPASIEKTARALKLNAEETAFFRSLVLLNQAGTVEEKKHHAEQIVSFRSYRKLHPLKKTQMDYFSRWYYVAVRELVATRDFQEDPEWIARALSPPITVSEARQALEALTELGLVKRGEQGRLIQSQATVTSGDEVTSAALAQLHKELIQKGSEAINRHPQAERDISFVTLGLSEKSAREIKELIQRFRKQLLEISCNDPEPTGVYEVNFQFFPLTRISHQGSSREALGKPTNGAYPPQPEVKKP